MNKKGIINTVLFLSISASILWRSEIFSQQLQPLNIRSPHSVKYPGVYPTYGDTTRTFGVAVPTNINGEMVGVANSAYLDQSMNPNGQWANLPHLYKLDSTGNYMWLKNYKFISSRIKYEEFYKVIPHKDSLYIIGVTFSAVGSCETGNLMIIKTNSSGTIDWKNEWGDDGSCEAFADETICSDGGIAFCGGNGYQTGTYGATKTFVVKYNANGTLKFNKSFQIPIGNDEGRGYMSLTSIIETADKGYLISGTALLTDSLINSAFLFLIKLDANGNKLWDKTVLNDYKLQYTKWLSPFDMIPHPLGGYVLVGNTTLSEWDSASPDSAYVGGSYHHYTSKYSGGLIVKITENGGLEWIKSFRDPNAVKTPFHIGSGTVLFSFRTIIPSTTGSSGFIISGIKSSGTSINDSIISYTHSITIKIDLNGNIVWDREYGSFVWDPSSQYAGYAEPIYQEAGGAFVLNSLASPKNTDQFPSATDRGVLRLKSDGTLGDPACSLSPLLSVYNDDIIVTYKENVSFETFPFDQRIFSTATSYTFNRLPVVSNEVCTNPIYALFNYTISCNTNGQGANITFNNYSAGGSWYHYDFGDPASGSKNTADSSNTYHIYNTTNTYTVTLTVYDGDSSKTDVYRKQIIIPAIRNITIYSSNTIICEGSSVNLIATISNGYFPVSHFEIKKNSGSNLNVYNYAVYYSDSTFSSSPLDRSLSFYINSTDKCVFSDTVEVTVLPTVHMSVMGDSLLCAGDSSLLVASGSATYLWNPGNSSTDSLIIHPNNTVVYSVSSGQSKVCGVDSAKINITVYPLPTISAGEYQIIYTGSSTQLNASGGSKYLWTPDNGLSSTTIANPIASPENTTTYTITATDANGCKGSDTITIYVQKSCGELFVPQAFSPNGDEKNDVLYLQDNCIKELLYSIYDRWGNKVFESSKITDGWDGSYKGKAMDPGVFVYNINATLFNNDGITKKGNVTLMK